MKTKIIPKIFVTPIVVLASLLLLQATSQSQAASQFELVSTIAFSSTRDTGRLQIYLIDPDGTNARQLHYLVPGQQEHRLPRLRVGRGVADQAGPGGGDER